MTSAVIFQIQSFIIVALFFIGYYYRILERRHIKFVATAIVWDLALILQIELSRGAIDKATKAMTNPVILNVHIALAITAVLLYFFMIYTGLKLKKRDESVRNIHRRAGKLVLVIRTLVLITSFFAMTK